MAGVNFSEAKIEEVNGSDEESVLDRPVRIVFDYDQLYYIKFRLSFGDGFWFGLGIIAAGIFVSIVSFLISVAAGASLLKLIFG